MLISNSSSTSSIVKNGRIYFKSSNATWDVPVMQQVGSIARKLDGRTVYHELFELEEWEKQEWPWATHRMALTSFREQSDPLFSSCPVGLKPGTKFQLLLAYNGESGRLPHDQWKIEALNLAEKAA